MTSPVPLSGNELAVIRLLRDTAQANCPRTRMEPTRRRVLRDALVDEARTTLAEGSMARIPRQRDARVLRPASA